MLQLEFERIEHRFIIRKSVGPFSDLVTALSHQEVKEIIETWLSWWLNKRHELPADKESA